MPDDPAPLRGDAAIDAACDRFESAWKAVRDADSAEPAEPPRLRPFLAGDLASEDAAALLAELIGIDRHYRLATGQTATLDDLIEREPALATPVADAIAAGRLEPATLIGAAGDATLGDQATITHAPSGSPTSEGRHANGQADAPPVGTAVKYFGDYELVGEIARGGMGVVYRARQQSLSREIALKMILGGQLADPEAVRRFHFEAESAARLSHPGIVPIYDVGEHDGRHYFTMKLIEGDPLGAVADRYADPMEAASLVGRVADAMHHAHQRGILHRDLKPSNILIDRGGSPIVTDFGLARVAERTDDDEPLTQSGAVVGTPGFMSPEQARGDAVTAAADIYSLGAILYRLLCGRPPHSGANVMATLLSVAHDEPDPPSSINAEVPRDLELIVSKCLAKEPAERYASAAELARDLRAVRAGEPLIVRPPSAWELMRNWMRSNVGQVGWVPIIAATLGTAIGFSLWAATFGSDAAELRRSQEPLRPYVPLLQRVDWDRFGMPMLALLVISLSLIGLLTHRLVRTKTRFADAAAGLSVGLLTGLIALIAGMGPVFMVSYLALAQDGNASADLNQLAALAESNSDWVIDRVRRAYPDADEGLTRNQAAAALKARISSGFAFRTLPGMWIGSVMVLSVCGLGGLFQTVMAGLLSRTRSPRLALFGYVAVALGVAAATVLLWIDASMFALSGFLYTMRWTWWLLTMLAAAGLVAAVLRNGRPIVQVALLSAVAYCFVAYMVTHFFAISPPQLNQARGRIAERLRRIAADPQAIEPRQELVNDRLRLANLFAGIDWIPEADEQYALARADLARLDARDPDSLANLDRGVRDLVHRMPARQAIRRGDFDGALELLDAGQKQLGFDIDLALLRLQILTERGDGEAIERMLRSVRFHPDDSGGKHSREDDHQMRGLLLHLGLRSERVRRGWTWEQAEPWRRGVVEAVIAASDFGDDDALRDRYRRWLLGTQTWHLAGPFDLPDPTTPEGLRRPIGPEAALLADAASVVPDRAETIEIGAPIWFRAIADPSLDPALAAIEQAVWQPESIGWDRDHAAVLAWTTFETAEAGIVRIVSRSDDGVRYWVDGEEFLLSPEPRSVPYSRITVGREVAAGRHTLVVKVAQERRDWGFLFDLYDDDGQPLPTWGEPLGPTEPEDAP